MIICFRFDLLFKVDELNLTLFCMFSLPPTQQIVLIRYHQISERKTKNWECQKKLDKPWIAQSIRFVLFFFDQTALSVCFELNFSERNCFLFVLKSCLRIVSKKRKNSTGIDKFPRIERRSVVMAWNDDDDDRQMIECDYSKERKTIVIEKKWFRRFDRLQLIIISACPVHCDEENKEEYYWDWWMSESISFPFIFLLFTRIFLQ